MEKNNFVLTRETKVEFGIPFTRIKAARDLPCGVKKGELGGWVSGDARVCGDAHIDSASAIIVLCIAIKYSVTVTRKYLFIGCKMFKREKAVKFTSKDAAKLGLPKQYFQAYKMMILGAMKLVKDKK